MIDNFCKLSAEMNLSIEPLGMNHRIDCELLSIFPSVSSCTITNIEVQ